MAATDPRISSGLWVCPRARQADFCVLVDFENQPLPLGRAAQLARLWGAEHVRAADLSLER